MVGSDSRISFVELEQIGQIENKIVEEVLAESESIGIIAKITELIQINDANEFRPQPFPFRS